MHPSGPDKINTNGPAKIDTDSHGKTNPNAPGKVHPDIHEKTNPDGNGKTNPDGPGKMDPDGPEKIYLPDLNISELEEFLTGIGQKKFRAKQVFSWIARGAVGFDEMTDLPLSLREELKLLARVSGLKVRKKFESAIDGTVKYLFELDDGNIIESVLMEDPAVRECAVTGASDPVRGTVVKATVVLTSGYCPCDQLIKELQEHVKKQTAPYKYPRIVEFVDELPKTFSGKIKRAEIRRQDETRKTQLIAAMQRA